MRNQAGTKHECLIERFLTDVIPFNLGIEVVTGELSVLIAKNTAIPFYHDEIFTTTEDNQIEVLIKVYQGNRTMAAENYLLGEFLVTGLKPAPAR